MILMPLKEMKNSSSDTVVNMNKISKLVETNRLNLIGTSELCKIFLLFHKLSF